MSSVPSNLSKMLSPDQAQMFLEDILKCPLSKTYYSDQNLACTLVAKRALNSMARNICGHTFCEPVVNGLFRSVKPLCPLCSEEIVAYIANPLINSIVEEILSLTSPSVPFQVEPNIQENPFPLQKIPFKVVKDWDEDVKPLAMLLCRSLKYTAQHPDSPFTLFSLNGYADGSLQLDLEWDENKREMVRKYLASQNIVLEKGSLSHQIFKTLPEVKRVFEVLNLHGQIPKAELIGRLIEKGDWTKVTPCEKKRIINQFFKKLSFL